MTDRAQIEQALKVLQPFRAMLNIGDALLQVGDLERAKQEAENALAKQEKENSEYAEKIARAQQIAQNELEARQREAAGIVQRATAQAEEIASQANSTAAKTLADAKAKVGSMVADAEAKTKRQIDLAETATAQLKATNDAIAEKAAELATIEGKIAKAREAAAAMLGA